MATERILLIRLSHLGDVVHALPVFHALREARPQARIGWVTQPEFAGLLEGLPGLEAVHRFRRRGGARAWLELRQELAAFDADLVVDAQGNLKSAFCALVAGGRRRLGPARQDWREPLGRLATTEAAAPAGGEHALDRAAALARAAAGPAWSGRLRRDPGLRPDELAAGRARWQALVPRAGERPPVLVHLAAPGDVRSWPGEHFAALAGELARAGRAAVYVSGPAEAAAGAALEAVACGPAATHWVGQRGLRALAAVFTAAAESGARLVACDSGPLHLAAACGLPVACLSGPQSHLRTGPWPVPDRGPGPHRVLLAARPPSCAPCLSRRCTHAEGPVCMRAIDPLAVAAALRA